MKRFTAILLAAIMIISLSSCQFLTTEKTLSIYNASSEAFIDCVAIATTPDVLNNEDAIILFDASNKMDVSTSKSYKFKVQDSMIDGTWYIYVSGSDAKFAKEYGFTEMFKIEESIEGLFSGDIHGIQIDYDKENQTFVITSLSGI